MKKCVTGNASRQRRFRAKRSESGLKRLEIWVSPEQEREIRRILRKTDVLAIFRTAFQKIH